MSHIPTPYHEDFDALENIYLEDSYVLNISKEKDSVVFEMEFVLTHKHSLYRPAKKNEKYCYRHGRLQFSECSMVRLQRSNCPPSTDANGDIDFGNVDSFVKTNEKVSLNGCWGVLEADCAKVSVEFDNIGSNL